MTTKEMIETLRYKAENIKAKIDPEFFNEVADKLEKQAVGWISVKDRLPEDDVRVLIQVRWACVLIALRRNGEWNGLWENYEDDDVLYWQPLPKLHREDGGIGD